MSLIQEIIEDFYAQKSDVGGLYMCLLNSFEDEDRNDWKIAFESLDDDVRAGFAPWLSKVKVKGFGHQIGWPEASTECTKGELELIESVESFLVSGR